MTKPGNNEQKQEDKQPMLHLRLTGKVRENVADAAAKAGRTLTKEVERRLEASLADPATTPPDALVYGWANPGFAEVLGDALGMLAGRLEDAVPVPSASELDPAGRLAMLKLAIGAVLDQLGASATLSAEPTNLAQLVARQFAGDFQRVEPDPASYSQRSDLAVIALLKQSLETDASQEK